MAEIARALAPCVHCGFCLPACPTYLITGDENDGPRGRIVLMQQLLGGQIAASDPLLRHHLERCLGCRGCEPACPSGVQYGAALAETRHTLRTRTRDGIMLGLMLKLFESERLWRPLLSLARRARDMGLLRLLAGRGRLGYSAATMAATRPSGAVKSPRDVLPPSTGDRGTVALFRGCVMDTVLGHVHQATRRTLLANGFEVIDVAGQSCCGALHEHAGDRDTAIKLARQNIEVLLDRADWIVVNSAGCGALMKDYHHLVPGDSANRFSAKVRDVSELLAGAGPRQGAPLAMTVAWDAPCHLIHAQRLELEPLRLLRAVPALEIKILPDADRCCGSAGLYSLLQPDMAGEVLTPKLEGILAMKPLPDSVVTANPGCLMHIGAGLMNAGSHIPVQHPVEILDRSYQQAGFYQA